MKKRPNEGTSSYEILRRALSGLGIKRVARELRISAALLYKWCQPPRTNAEGLGGSGALNPLDRLDQIIGLTRDDELLAWLCQRSDGFFVKNPSPTKREQSLELMTEIQRLVKEFSDTLDAISRSCLEDKEIDGTEARRIRREWEPLKRVGESFVRSCESGRYFKNGNRKNVKRPGAVESGGPGRKQSGGPGRT